MAGLSDFSNDAFNDGVDVANLPREGRGGAPPPPMGAYIFALSPLEIKNFGVMNTQNYGQRAYVNFNQDAPLVIKQDVGGKHVGEPVRTLVNNMPRPRGKGDDAPKAADWDYLNQALGISLPKRTNRAYVDALIEKSKARAEFGANITYRWECDRDRDAYFEQVPQGGLPPEGAAPTYGPQPDPNNAGQNIKGCGAKFYPGREWKTAEFNDQGELTKKGAVARQDVPGGYDYRVTCQNCGALLRAQVDLENYRKAGSTNGPQPKP